MKFFRSSRSFSDRSSAVQGSGRSAELPTNNGRDEAAAKAVESTRWKALSPVDIEKRRKEEMEFIKLNDMDDAQIWFLVDVEWLQKWKAFIKGDGQMPGPIDNQRLIMGSGQPRPGLRVVDHYRGVNYRMWDFWLKRYGGGPEVRRKNLNLYSEAADDLDGTTTVPNLPASTRKVPGEPLDDLEATCVVPRKSLPPVQEREEPPVEVRPPRGRSSKKDAEEEKKNRARAVSVPPRPGKKDKAVVKVGPSKCDKCDGPHDTDSCPHFKKPREKHKDAWSMLGRKSSSSAKEEVVIVKSARVVRQPGDGSCLFHSLNYGLTGSSSGGIQCRRKICEFMTANPDIEVGENTLEEWVKYENGSSVRAYVRSMEGSSWGGGIEMAAFAKMNNVNVHVYESHKGAYKRISAFESSGGSKTISVLYQGRAHYDALVI